MNENNSIVESSSSEIAGKASEFASIFFQKTLDLMNYGVSKEDLAKISVRPISPQESGVAMFSQSTPSRSRVILEVVLPGGGRDFMFDADLSTILCSGEDLLVEKEGVYTNTEEDTITLNVFYKTSRPVNPENEMKGYRRLEQIIKKSNNRNLSTLTCIYPIDKTYAETMVKYGEDNFHDQVVMTVLREGLRPLSTVNFSSLFLPLENLSGSIMEHVFDALILLHQNDFTHGDFELRNIGYAESSQSSQIVIFDPEASIDFSQENSADFMEDYYEALSGLQGLVDQGYSHRDAAVIRDFQKIFVSILNELEQQGISSEHETMIKSYLRKYVNSLDSLGKLSGDFLFWLDTFVEKNVPQLQGF